MNIRKRKKENRDIYVEIYITNKGREKGEKTVIHINICIYV